MSRDYQQFAVSRNKSKTEDQLLTEKANELDTLQAEQNTGRGVSCIRGIVHCLRRGDINTAKRVYQSEGDKIREYPKIQEWLEKRFGCRIHLKKNCNNWLCKKINNTCNHTKISKNGTCEDCSINIDHFTDSCKTEFENGYEED